MQRSEYEQYQYQEKEYYDTNKDNFSNSLFGANEHFEPGAIRIDHLRKTSFLNFGRVEEKEIEGKHYFYLVFPPGLTVYHGSRNLQINSLFSDFPIKEYSNLKTPEENKENILKNNNDVARFKFPESTNDYSQNYHVSFYSTPPNSREYLSKGTANSQNFRYNNDLPYIRLKAWRRITGEEFESTQDSIIIDYEHAMSKNMVDYKNLETYIVYRTKKEIKLLLLSVDNIAPQEISNHENIINILTEKNLTKLAEKYPYLFGHNYGSPLEEMYKLRFQDIDDSVESYALALDNFLSNMDIHRAEEVLAQISGIVNYEELSRFYVMVIDLKKRLQAYENTDQYYYQVLNYVTRYNLIDQYRYMKNYRYSTYFSDRPFFNAFESIFSPIFDGTISGPIFNYNGKFDGEMALFYAPDVLERQPLNPFDIHYGMGFGGFVDELRRYEITNACNQDNVLGSKICHTGHLFEHSSWTLLYTQYLIENLARMGINVDVNIEKILLFSSLFHDIGKAGACDQAGKIAFVNHHQSFMSEVLGYYSYGKNLTDITETTCYDQNGVFKYENIPDHPERGYRYLTGEMKFVTSSMFGVNEYTEINLLTKFNENIPLGFRDDPDFIKKTALVIATHYYAGLMLYSGNNLEQNIPRYIEKIKFYYNALFDNYDAFSDLVRIIFIVSTADILAQRSLTSDMTQEKWGILDEFPITEFYDLKWVGNRNLVTFTDDFNAIFSALDAKLQEPVININFLNNYNIKNNSMIYVDSLEVLFKIYRSYLPKTICFDFDDTLGRLMMDLDPESRNYGTFYGYEYIPATLNLLISLQFVRRLGVKIALVSRHYIPDEMKDELIYSASLKKLYPDKTLGQLFDTAVILRTGVGNVESFAIFEEAYYEKYRIRLKDMKDFIYENGVIRNIELDFDGEVQKNTHFEYLDRGDAILFDDDDNYLTSGVNIPDYVTPIRVTYDGTLDARQTFGTYFYNKINP